MPLTIMPPYFFPYPGYRHPRPYLKETQTCPVPEDIASRIACLPLYAGQEDDRIREICAELV